MLTDKNFCKAPLKNKESKVERGNSALSAKLTVESSILIIHTIVQ